MSHVTSPIGFRTGKATLGNHNALITANNQQTALDQRANLAPGLDSAIDGLLRRDNYFSVRTVSKLDPVSGVTKVKLLYYPLIAPVMRKRPFPTYCAPRRGLAIAGPFDTQFQQLMIKMGDYKTAEFLQRFNKSKKRPQLNKGLTQSMFRGSHLYRSARYSLGANINALNRRAITPTVSERYKAAYARFNDTPFHGLVRRPVGSSVTNYRARPNRGQRGRHAEVYRVSDQQLSRRLALRVGLRTQVQAVNVFEYLVNKSTQVRYKSHQEHLGGGKYHYYKKRFSAYYDVVNSLHLLCQIPYTERLVISMIQYGLRRMHKRKIKPKQFFYFIDNVLKNMPAIRETFESCRIVITGKLRGGTARTTTYSAGFGVFPRQTLSEDIRYELGDLRSKYGSFGIKVLTGRKSQYKYESDMKIAGKSTDKLRRFNRAKGTKPNSRLQRKRAI